MARGRMIDKRIAKSKKLAALKYTRSRLLYFMILPHLDVEGRFTGDPEEIKEDCVPKLRFSINQIAESLIDMSNEELLILYEHNGIAYIQYTRFSDFQIGLRKEKESSSHIPPPLKRRTYSVLPPSWSGLSLSLSLSLRKLKEGKPCEVIHFNFESRKWENIKIEDKSGWLAAYPACDIELELYKMREWLLANPDKRKKNYRRFIVNWLTRTQDKGGSEKIRRHPGGRPMTRKDERKEAIEKWVDKPTKDKK